MPYGVCSRGVFWERSSFGRQRIPPFENISACQWQTAYWGNTYLLVAALCFRLSFYIAFTIDEICGENQVSFDIEALYHQLAFILPSHQ
jgi:hypothetical protein